MYLGGYCSREGIDDVAGAQEAFTEGCSIHEDVELEDVALRHLHATIDVTEGAVRSAGIVGAAIARGVHVESNDNPVAAGIEGFAFGGGSDGVASAAEVVLERGRAAGRLHDRGGDGDLHGAIKPVVVQMLEHGDAHILVHADLSRRVHQLLAVDLHIRLGNGVYR